MSFGAEDEEAARGAHLLGFGIGRLLMLRHALGKEPARGDDVLVVGVGKARGLGDDALVKAGLAQVGLGHELGVAAEDDVGASAGHVGRDSDRAELARLRDDLRLLLMVLGVEHRMRYAALFQQRRDIFALLDGHRADQHGLPLFVAGDDLLDNGAVLARVVFIHDVGVVDPDNGLIGRDLDDIELVYGFKLLGLGRGGACHAGELAVEAEVVLEGNGREGAVLFLHVDVLLGLDRLMQTLGVAAVNSSTMMISPSLTI